MKTPGGTRVDVLVPRDTQPFTYRLPDGLSESLPAPGTRIRVPFRSGILWGIVWAFPTANPGAQLRLRDALELDTHPLLSEAQLELIRWISSYYLRSPGLVLKTMCPPGLLEGRKGRKPRIAALREPDSAARAPRHSLSPVQKAALETIRNAGTKPVVLFGVTGSGKTEVYLQAIGALPRERGALVLVPEISLTTQTAERFLDRFGDQVAILHSGLSAGERLAAWRRLREGEARIALGTRSAVFAPVPSPGLIVVDEEHSHTYKQEEGLRYHARDLAVVRGMIENSPVVLGSATPSLESFYNATKGKYALARLPERVEARPAPSVRLLDLRGTESSETNVSPQLLSAIAEETRAGNQVMILLNRRGYAPYVICNDCGHHWKCPQCSIALTFHKRSNRLRCHYCGTSAYPPSQCPSCGGTRNRTAGVGTEKLEEELATLFTGVGIHRMDADTTRRKLSHGRIIRAMEEGDIGLLIGTQMLAKGHDLPGVTLGGVVSADDTLHLPDFRAPEKAFQLLHQFAGRTGRGSRPGTVYIETREPEHPIYRHIVSGDFEAFFREETESRKDLWYPPFGYLVRLIFSARLRAEMDSALDRISTAVRGLSRTSVEVLGPGPCPLERIRGRIRYHLLLKGRKRDELRRTLLALLAKIGEPKGVRVDVDVDPVQMM